MNNFTQGKRARLHPVSLAVVLGTTPGLCETLTRCGLRESDRAGRDPNIALIGAFSSGLPQ